MSKSLRDPARGLGVKLLMIYERAKAVNMCSAFPFTLFSKSQTWVALSRAQLPWSLPRLGTLLGCRAAIQKKHTAPSLITYQTFSLSPSISWVAQNMILFPCFWSTFILLCKNESLWRLPHFYKLAEHKVGPKGIQSEYIITEMKILLVYFHLCWNCF